MSDSLDDLLNGVDEVEVEAEADTETKDATVETETETEVEAETQETEVTAEVEDTTTVSEKDDEPQEWTKAAVIDERRKRQEIERRNADLQKRLDALENGTGKRPDVFDDQEGAFSHLKQEMASELHATRLEMSQELMREKYENYDELEAEFIDMAKDNPVLLKELNESRNPAKFAAETALKARQVAELKDVDKLRADIEAKVRKEIEEKLKAEQADAEAKDAKKREALMPSLAASQSKSGIDDAEDESLEAILNSR